MKHIDDKIRSLIQVSEKEIPMKVEESFLQALKNATTQSGSTRKGNRLFYRIALATAACLLIATLVFLPRFSRIVSRHPADDIIVESAKIEGQAARTIIFKEQNPELTIVWVEK